VYLGEPLEQQGPDLLVGLVEVDIEGVVPPAVARIRSVVSCSVVYSSFRKPQNSDPVVLASVRSFSPETAQALRSAPRPSTVTTVVRVSPPLRTKE
jgi:hypothetical protein